MDKEFILQGLSCADCAAQIERAAGEMEGVLNASINFISSTLRLELNDNHAGDIRTSINNVVHMHEPDILVIEKNGATALGAGYARDDTEINVMCDGAHADNRTACKSGDHNVRLVGDHNAHLLGGHNAHPVDGHAASHADDAHDHPHVGEENSVSATGYINTTARKRLTQICVGAVLLAAGIILEHFTEASVYITAIIYAAGYLLLGGKIVVGVALHIVNEITHPQKRFIERHFFNERFLMSAATIGAFAIGEAAEAVAVMLFYQIGLFFEDMAVRKSKKSIAKLMDLRPDYMNLIADDGQTIKTAPEAARIGDIIIVKPGEKIPLDGIVIEGEAALDTSALTGESLPKMAVKGDQVLSGCVNLNSVIKIEVTRTFGESTVSKILELVENAAAKKAPIEKFITKFARYYTPIVMAAAALVATIPPLVFGGAWADWIGRGLIFLVISCPCALVVSVPLSFYAGIGGASARGILIKGGNYLDALAKLDTVVFDKTGTLTKGVFNVTSVKPAAGFNRDELLEAAAYAESFSSHPIASSVMREYEASVNNGARENKNIIDPDAIKEHSELAGLGARVNARGKIIAAGNARLMASMGVVAEEPHTTGTVVHVATDGAYMGYIRIADEVRPDSRHAVAALRSIGVEHISMLTGDNARIAGTIAGELGISEVYAGLLPQQKVETLEKLNGKKRKNSALAFVGDGINDAPVLAMADIGVAMGGLGSDAAIEAADVVLMTDEPSKLVEAVDAAKFTRRIAMQNITFALGVKAIFLLLGAFGLAGMWEAVFADAGVMVIAILNAMRAKSHKQ